MEAFGVLKLKSTIPVVGTDTTFSITKDVTLLTSVEVTEILKVPMGLVGGRPSLSVN